MNIRILTLTTLAAALAACSSVPASNPQLDQVRMRYQAAQSDPALAQNAPEEWTRARVALGRAEKAQTGGEPAVDVTHLSYLAHQQITIAQDAAASRASQATIDGTAAEADRMRLALRTQEADATQRALLASQADSARKSADLAQAGRNAQDDQARLARRDAQLDSMAQQLKDLNARKTERGIVVTLGDMLFDTGQARLQADGARSIVQLAEFMKRNPQRQAVIDGYTDSVGSDTFNQGLSDRRAMSVQTALVGLGVEPARLRTAGHGESDPVASNDTAQGRQSNRRVEIVFAPEAGDLLGK